MAFPRCRRSQAMFAPNNQPPEFRNLPDRCLPRDAKSTGTIGTCIMVPHRQSPVLCRNLPGSPFWFSPGNNVTFRNSPGLAFAGICRIAYSNSPSQPPQLQAFSLAPNWPAPLPNCRILPEPPISYQAAPFSRLSVCPVFASSFPLYQKTSFHAIPCTLYAQCVDKTLESAICSPCC